MNMQEFIDQKKEMFHAELAYKNVQTEISLLTGKKREREQALKKSIKELEKDHDSLMNFMAEDDRKKKEKESKEKQAYTKR